MLKKISWKKKNRLLFIGVLPVLWMVYVFALKNTFDAGGECTGLQLRLDSAADAPSQLDKLKQELLELEAITGNDTSDALHEHLLSIVTNYCQQNNLTLRDFSPAVRYHQQEWIVETHPFTVEGSYISLVKLIYRLEQEKTGKVVSVNFFSKKDNKTQTTSLLVTIYVQNIIHNKT